MSTTARPTDGPRIHLGAWRMRSTTAVRRPCGLFSERQVQEARLVKELSARDGHPFLYVRHRFEGGSGAISASTHAMTRFAHRGRLAFSAKAFSGLPDVQQEPDPANRMSSKRLSIISADIGPVLPVSTIEQRMPLKRELLCSAGPITSTRSLLMVAERSSGCQRERIRDGDGVITAEGFNGSTKLYRRPPTIS